MILLEHWVWFVPFRVRDTPLREHLDGWMNICLCSYKKLLAQVISLVISWISRVNPFITRVNYLVAHPTNRKWVITPVISRLTLLIPFITGVITHLLSGMSHQVTYLGFVGSSPPSRRCLVGTPVGKPWRHDIPTTADPGLLSFPKFQTPSNWAIKNTLVNWLRKRGLYYLVCWGSW